MYYLVLFIPVAVAVLSFLWGLITRSRSAHVMTVVFAVISTALWGVDAYFFKDGLAPGFSSSSGLVSFLNFAQGFYIPFVFFSALCFISAFVHRKKKSSVNA